MSNVSNKEKAAKLLEDNPNIDTVYITSDGYPFLSENTANLHATKNATGKTLTVTIYKREPGDAPKKKDKAKTPAAAAKERIAAIEAMETIEDVKAALEGETAKTVKAAGEKRIEELTAAAEGGNGDDGTNGSEDTPGGDDNKNSESPEDTEKDTNKDTESNTDKESKNTDK